jgi:hypothetical protein
MRSELEDLGVREMRSETDTAGATLSGMEIFLMSALPPSVCQLLCPMTMAVFPFPHKDKTFPFPHDFCEPKECLNIFNSTYPAVSQRSRLQYAAKVTAFCLETCFLDLLLTNSKK